MSYITAYHTVLFTFNPFRIFYTTLLDSGTIRCIACIIAFHTVLFKFNPFRIFHTTLLDSGTISYSTACRKSLHVVHHCISYSVIHIQSLQDFSYYFARQWYHFVIYCMSYITARHTSLHVVHHCMLYISEFHTVLFTFIPFRIFYAKHISIC